MNAARASAAVVAVLLVAYLGICFRYACGHVRAYSRHPAEWEARVLAFLERELR